MANMQKSITLSKTHAKMGDFTSAKDLFCRIDETTAHQTKINPYDIIGFHINPLTFT